jgi:hypothetical protein
MTPPDHKAFIQPVDSSLYAWRYMDLPKLLSMILRRELHLTRLDRLEDKFEGTLPLRTRTAMLEPFLGALRSRAAGPLIARILRLPQRLAALQESPESAKDSVNLAEALLDLIKMGRGYVIGAYESKYKRTIDGPQHADESNEEYSARLTLLEETVQELALKGVLYARQYGHAPLSLDELRQWSEGTEAIDPVTGETLLAELVDALVQYMGGYRQRLYVNSWHLGSNESEAMWRIYCGSDNGLAVVLPYSDLRGSISAADTYVGKVTYLKFDLDLINEIDAPHGFAVAMQKRKEFEYESEARIVAWRAAPGKSPLHDPGPESVELPWAPEDLIEKIVVSPYATSWYAETVREIVGRIAPKLHGRVVASSMAGDPFP